MAYAALTGVAGTNTITATGPANFSYAAGKRIYGIAAATNTGATTINVTPSGASALGARNVFYNGVACVGGEIQINQPFELLDDGTRFHLLGAQPGGTYTPTLSAGTNVGASTMRLATYMRSRDMVFVFGNVDIDPTAAVATSFELDLPVASNLANSYELGGAGAFDGTASSPSVLIFGSVANNTATFAFLSATTANATLSYCYGYRVIA